MAGSAVQTGGARVAPKRHSPVFLAVFAVFIVATTICVAGTVLGVLEARPAHHDTQCFWISGQLLAHGHNPYDLTRIRPMEISLGLHVGSDLPITRNPPPALFLTLPLGFLGPRISVLVWSLLLGLCLFISVKALGVFMPAQRDFNYLLLAWCFPPALCGIEMGQSGLIVLAGLALFLWLHEKAPLWAGAALSLCAIKPHLLLPFGLILLVWLAERKRWKILAGAIAAVAMESLIVMAFDPAVWANYRTAMHQQYFVEEFVPTLGVALRFMVDQTAMWVEFVPAMAGCIWALWYFWRNREQWNWRTHGSLLTLVSLAAAPYSWFTDQVIALPAILFALMGQKPLRRGSITLLLAVMSAGAVEMMSTKTLYSKPYLFEGLAWLGWYLYAVSGRAEKTLLAEPASV